MCAPQRGSQAFCAIALCRRSVTTGGGVSPLGTEILSRSRCCSSPPSCHDPRSLLRTLWRDVLRCFPPCLVPAWHGLRLDSNLEYPENAMFCIECRFTQLARKLSGDLRLTGWRATSTTF